MIVGAFTLIVGRRMLKRSITLELIRFINHSISKFDTVKTMTILTPKHILMS